MYIYIVRKVFCLLSGNSRLDVFLKPSYPDMLNI